MADPSSNKVGAQSMWSKMRDVARNKDLSREQKLQKFKETMRAAQALERERRKIDDKAKKARLDSLALTPQLAYARRICGFKQLAGERPDYSQSPQLKKIAGDGSGILSAVMCFKINDHGKLEPRIVTVLEKVIFVLNPKEIKTPKRKIVMSDVEGVVENATDTELGIVCNRYEYDMHLNVQTKEMKEHFVATLYSIFERAGRKLKMWTTPEVARALRLSKADMGEHKFIPMRAGPYDLLHYASNEQVSQQFLAQGDCTVFLSTQVQHPKGSRVAFTDFSMYELNRHDVVIRRYNICHFKYLVKKPSDTTFFSFTTNDTDVASFEVLSDKTHLIMEYFQKNLPSLEIVDAEEHRRRLDIESAKNNVEVDLEAEERFQEEEQRKKEQKLLEENEYRLYEEREAIIAAKIDETRKEMLRVMEERSAKIKQSVLEREAERERQRKQEAERAGDAMATLMTQIEEEKEARAREKKQEEENESYRQRDRDREKESEKRWKKLLGSNSEMEQQILALQSELEDERRRREREKEELLAKQSALQAQAQHLAAAQKEQLKRELQQSSADIEATQKLIEAEKLGAVQDRQKFADEAEAQRKLKEDREKRAQQEEIRELQRMDKGGGGGGDDDERGGSLEDLLRQLRDQRLKLHRWEQQRKREQQAHAEERQQLQAQLARAGEESAAEQRRVDELRKALQAEEARVAERQAAIAACECGVLQQDALALTRAAAPVQQQLAAAREARAAEEARFQASLGALDTPYARQKQELNAKILRLEQELEVWSAKPTETGIHLLRYNDVRRQLAEVQDALRQHGQAATVGVDDLRGVAAAVAALEHECASLTEQLRAQERELAAAHQATDRAAGGVHEAMQWLQDEISRCVAERVRLEREAAGIEAELGDPAALAATFPTVLAALEAEDREERRVKQEREELTQRLERLRAAASEPPDVAGREQAEREAAAAEQSLAELRRQLAEEQAKTQALERENGRLLPLAHREAPVPDTLTTPVEEDGEWLRDIIRERQVLQSAVGGGAGTGSRMVFSRFRTSCYTVTRDRDGLTSTAAVNTVAICNRLLHDGRHTWKVRTSNGALKAGVALHAITVLNYTGSHSSWVLTRTGEALHDNAPKPCTAALRPNDVVTLVLDLDLQDGALLVAVNGGPLVTAYTGLAKSAPFVPVVELYDRGDSCQILEYQGNADN